MRHKNFNIWNTDYYDLLKLCFEFFSFFLMIIPSYTIIITVLYCIFFTIHVISLDNKKNITIINYLNNRCLVHNIKVNF